jgi:hypothetical protein
MTHPKIMAPPKPIRNQSHPNFEVYLPIAGMASARLIEGFSEEFAEFFIWLRLGIIS